MMKYKRFFFKNIYAWIALSFVFCFYNCKTKQVEPVWIAELRWSKDIDFIGLKNDSLYFNAYIATNDSLQKVDYQTLNTEERAKYNQPDTYLKMPMSIDTFCVNLVNGKYVKKQFAVFEQINLTKMCSLGKSSNIFKPNICETMVIKNYKGFTISIKYKKYIWRSDRNFSYTFNVYSKNHLISTIPVKTLGEFFDFYTDGYSIYYSWGGYYGKYFITKYNFDDLIR